MLSLHIQILKEIHYSTDMFFGFLKMCSWEVRANENFDKVFPIEFFSDLVTVDSLIHSFSSSTSLMNLISTVPLKMENSFIMELKEFHIICEDILRELG